ncbi:MAG: C4-type zinc ribbon domain-containing protein [Acidimicrobiia bacterium]
MGALHTLLDIQAHDTAADQVRHRRATIPERDDLAARQRELSELDDQAAALGAHRDELTARERALSDEVATLEERITSDEAKLYSGEIASPRELQALQADIDQLRRHQRGVEDRQLGVMEEREGIEARLAEVEEGRAAVSARADGLAEALREAEATCDEEIAQEEQARDELVATVPGSLADEYRRVRARVGGVGAARLVGDTCQGCHLSLPATEVARLRKQDDDVPAYCDNCGCILVPS